MKPFLLRACGKIGRFFWSWSFLKFVLWTITLIVFFYVEEDWRGARTWAATKAKWEAQGETFDIMRLAPRPVPDDKNLAALPLFKIEPDPNPLNHGHLGPVALRKALSWDIWPNNELPRGGMWEQGKLADAEKNRALVAAAYNEAFKGAPPTLDSFAQFSALVPAMDDLRAAAATRPYCRFEPTYRFDLPGESYLSLITEQIQLSRFLTADAILALDAKKPDVALADIVTHYKLLSGSIRQPTLISELVAIGMQAISLTAIYQGLATHAWNDQQLAQLQIQMSSIDFLVGYQNGIRGELCITVAAYDRAKLRREHLVSEIHSKPVTIPPAPPDRNWTPLLWPDGWIDLLKAHSANYFLTCSGMIDVPNHMVSPTSIKQFDVDTERKRGSHFFFPLWNSLFDEVLGSVAGATQKFAIAQVRLDEARIACALERYHLAHAAYPATLDELAPIYMDSIPHDIIDEKPYHYQARVDGTFQLYSVGWNQADDGGNFAFKKDNPKAIDYENGDWPWPTPR